MNINTHCYLVMQAIYSYSYIYFLSVKINTIYN